MEFLEKYVFSKILDAITGADGQQRIRATIVTLILSIAAKWGLPPEVAEWAANAIAGAGLALVTSWTVRKPGFPGAATAAPVLPAAPAAADGVPELPTEVI